MGGRKHSLNLIGPGQSQSPPVFFYNTYRFENKIHICFYILEIQYIYIYWAHTDFDLGMSNMGDALCRHPNHSSRTNISQTPLMEWIKVSPYATSITSRLQEPVVLCNHHRVLMTSHHHIISSYNIYQYVTSWHHRNHIIYYHFYVKPSIDILKQ